MLPFYDFIEYTTQEASSGGQRGVKLSDFFVPGSRLTLGAWVGVEEA